MLVSQLILGGVVMAKKKTKPLYVKSVVKAIISKSKMRVSGDFWNALNDEIASHLEKAVKRAKANGRKTLRASDL